jgi:N6-L-threonylcarbamoyladenine synthase
MALILGLESSCDDTAAALVTSDRQILAQAVVGQNEAHRPFGGVVPEIAARAHVEILPGLIEQVLGDAKLSLAKVDAVAATAGPGLIGGVMVALLAGKGLSLAAGKPLIAVNHLEGHALTPRLADPDLDVTFGYVCNSMRNIGPGGDPRWATLLTAVASCIERST